MKTKIIFLASIIIVFCIGRINSQIILSATKALLSENDRAILDNSLSKYTVFSIDKRELTDILRQTGKGQFRIKIDKELDWTLDLELNDMRAPDFRQTYTTNEGEFEYKGIFIVNTYKGKTSTGQVARFTIDENTFSGIILDDKFHYEIRPLKDNTQKFSGSIGNENLIVYRSSDIISKSNTFDYKNDADRFSINNEIEDNAFENITQSSTSFRYCWYLLKIATDADYHFYTGKGENDLVKTYSEIFSMLNKAEAVYESTFDMTFLITFQHVYTTNTVYTEQTDTDILFAQFINHWNTNRQTLPDRHIAHLFSGKNLNYMGVSRRGHVSDNDSYSLSRVYDSPYNSTIEFQYLTVAHEIGHNLNATHVSSTDCKCDNTLGYSIMCPAPPDTYTPRSLWFCDDSKNRIQTFIDDNINILSSTLLIYRILSGSLTGFNSYKAYYRIQSTQVINSGYTSYQSGDHIILSDGFRAKAGSTFIAKIEEPCAATYNSAPALVRKQQDIYIATAPIEEVTAGENMTEEVEVYPNPASSTVTVTAGNSAKINRIKISNSLGITVLSVSTDNTSSADIDISGLASGIYFVRVFIDDITHSVKVIKK